VKPAEPSFVIASEAKQSGAPHPGLLRRVAPRNDGDGFIRSGALHRAAVAAAKPPDGAPHC